MTSSSQKSQFRSTGRHHDGIHEEDLVPGRREPFRAVPINRKNLPSSFDSISRRNEKLDQVSKRNREELDLLEESDVDEENHITSKKNCYTRHNVDLDQQTSRPNRGTPRMLVRASESSQSVSSNKSSVLGISDDSTLVTEHLQKRIEDLENDVVMLKVQMRKLITQGSALAGGKNTSFDLSPFQASVIGRIVREDMFKAVKFLDQKTIQVQGQKLFLKCLQAGKFDEEQSDNKCLFDTIMKRARKSLNIFKSHVKSDIRKAARYQFARDGGYEKDDHWFTYVREFRSGLFEEAPDAVQSAWVVYVDNILGNVNKQWKSSLTRSNMNVSDIVTVSDEAYAMIVSQLDMLSWIEKANSQSKQQGESQKEQDTLPLRRNDRSPTDADDDEEDRNSNLQGKYEKTFNDLIERKKNDAEAWLSWDRGYRDKVSLSLRRDSQLPKSGRCLNVEEVVISNNEPEPEFEDW